MGSRLPGSGRREELTMRRVQMFDVNDLAEVADAILAAEGGGRP
jgi:hypothetical protein